MVFEIMSRENGGKILLNSLFKKPKGLKSETFCKILKKLFFINLVYIHIFRSQIIKNSYYKKKGALSSHFRQVDLLKI